MSLLDLNIATRHLIVVFSYLIFSLFIIAVIINFKALKRFFKKINKKTWIILALIFILSLWLNVFIAPHFHRWYLDEPWALEKAKTLITGEEFSSIVYRQSIGWPFFLSLVFRVFEISNYTALYTSSILGALTVFNIFFIGLLLTKNKNIGLWSAFLFSLIPLHITYSGSAISNVPSNFFFTLSLFVILFFYRKPSKKLLFLTLTSVGFAVLFRPENHALIILFFVGIVLFTKNYERLLTPRFYLSVALILILILPNLIQVGSFYFSNELVNQISDVDTTWGSSYFTRNKETIKGLFYNTIHPLFFSLLYIVGLILMFRKLPKQALYLILGMAPIIFVLLFYSYSPPRFLLGLYPFIVILAAYTINYLIELSKKRKIITPAAAIIILLLFSPYIKDVHGDVWVTHTLETKIPDLVKDDLKDECTIIAVQPTIIKATTSFEVISTTSFIEKTKIPSNDCVLFFEDMYCDGTFDNDPDCTYIKNNYETSIYLDYSYSEGDLSKTYLLHRIIK